MRPGLCARYVTAPAAEVEAILKSVGGLDRFLPASSRAAAAGLHHEQDRLSYRASHAILRLMAARALDQDPLRAATLPLTRLCRSCGSTGHGKPAVGGVELSLSRSSGVVMVGSAPVGYPIGVDIERLPGEIFNGFDAYALSACERDSLRPGDIAGRLRLWVGKEALLKATGHGLSVEPHRLTIVGGSCSGLAGAEELRLTWVDAPTGYAAAIGAHSTLDPVPVDVADLLG